MRYIYHDLQNMITVEETESHSQERLKKRS